MRKNLYESTFSEEITKTSKNLADKVKGVFKTAARNASAYSMATLLFYGASSLALPNSSEATVCTTHEFMTDRLKKRYSEEPVSMGLSSNGGVMEVYASEEGTWTLIITRPDGTSCLIDAGEYWEDLPKKLVQDSEA